MRCRFLGLSIAIAACASPMDSPSPREEPAKRDWSRPGAAAGSVNRLESHAFWQRERGGALGASETRFPGREFDWVYAPGTPGRGKRLWVEGTFVPPRATRVVFLYETYSDPATWEAALPRRLEGWTGLARHATLADREQRGTLIVLVGDVVPEAAETAWRNSARRASVTAPSTVFVGSGLR